MKRALAGLVLTVLSSLAACEEAAPPVTPKKPTTPLTFAPAVPGEGHLTEIRQMTKAGENAEAYWAFDGSQLTMQARKGDNDCDRIYRMSFDPNAAAPTISPVSNGKGATTCSYFLPGNKEVIYASTQLGGDACPPKPDHSLGYVWALYDTYDIFKANADGTNIQRLTSEKGYDAEGTVCSKDGSIIFTSTRDGDIDLYRMDADGKNVKRLTNTPGYDGGAFFNADCSKIVWRASRPRPGKELDDFKGLLAKGLVRPSKLELYVANSDGSDAQQITYLDAASFAPFWHPNGKRILFSSNYGDPKGREFDIWGINVDGTGLERITHAPGFDGFPMFSPDGQWLAFSSNRATAPGQHDTNVFIAKWLENPPASAPLAETSADRVMKDIAWLADPAREGRGVGQKGLEDSGAWIETRMKALGLQPGAENGYRDPFPIVTALKSEDTTKLSIDGAALSKEDYAVMGYSPVKADVTGELVFANYGIEAKDLGVDDFAKLDVKKKIVVVRRFVPEGGKIATTDAQRRYGDIRRKAFSAREKGAAALIVIDDPEKPTGAKDDWKKPEEAAMPSLAPEGYSDAGLPVVVVKRSTGLVDRMLKKKGGKATITIALTPVQSNAFNVVGRLVSESPNKLPGVVVIGAHYDHLGKGGRFSLSPHSDLPHVGADDNASGTAVLLEVARMLADKKKELRHDVVFTSFSGEESGVLGSAHLVQKWSKGKPKLDDVVAMLNMDMVGRMRDDKLTILGADTATEWKGWLDTACGTAKVDCAASGDGYGPSDQMSFYAAGVPVIHFFTGTHSDYHKPSDTPDKINAAGAAQVGKICAEVALQVGNSEKGLSFKSGIEGGSSHGDMRSFNASLGSIPNYGGPGPGKKGVLLDGVRPGGAAEKAGMKKGDVIVKIGASEIGSVEDLMYVLNAHKPGETVPTIVQRDGKDVKLDVTFQETKRH